MNALVGHVDVERITVGIGIDGDRLDPEPVRGFHDAAGNFAPIGDQKFRKHGSPLPASLGFLEAWGKRVNWLSTRRDGAGAGACGAGSWALPARLAGPGHRARRFLRPLVASDNPWQGRCRPPASRTA